MAELRRTPRFIFQLDVAFGAGDEVRRALTHDVSVNGVFVRTDELRPLKQLVRFSVIDPDVPDDPLELLGIVVRRVTPAAAARTDRPPGIGIDLFANGRMKEARWLDLVRRVETWAAQGRVRPLMAMPALPAQAPAHPDERRPRLTGTPTPAVAVPPAVLAAAQPTSAHPPLPSVDAIRRRHVRRPADFRVTVRPPGLRDLATFVTRDISEGGTFVMCQRLLPVGSEVDLRLVHPQSHAEFLLPGLVVRTVDALDAKEKGMGIRFDLSQVDRAAWAAFVGRVPARQPEVEPVPQTHRARFRALQRHRD